MDDHSEINELQSYSQHLTKLKSRVRTALNKWQGFRSSTPDDVASSHVQEESIPRSSFVHQKKALLEQVEQSAQEMGRLRRANSEIIRQGREAREELERLAASGEPRLSSVTPSQRQTAPDPTSILSLPHPSSNKFHEILSEVEHLSTTVSILQRERSELEATWSSRLKSLRATIEEKDALMAALAEESEPLHVQNRELSTALARTQGQLTEAREQLKSVGELHQMATSELEQLKEEVESLRDDAGHREKLVDEQDKAMSQLNTQLQAALAAATEWEKRHNELAVVAQSSHEAAEELQKMCARLIFAIDPKKAERLSLPASLSSWEELVDDAIVAHGDSVQARAAISTAMKGIEEEQEGLLRALEDAQATAAANQQRVIQLQSALAAQQQTNQSTQEELELALQAAEQRAAGLREELGRIQEELSAQCCDVETSTVEARRLKARNVQLESLLERAKSDAELKGQDAAATIAILRGQLQQREQELAKQRRHERITEHADSAALDVQKASDLFRTPRMESTGAKGETSVGASGHMEPRKQMAFHSSKVPTAEQLVLERDMALERCAMQMAAVEEEKEKAVAVLKKQNAALQRQLTIATSKLNATEQELQQCIGDREAALRSVEQHRKVIEFLQQQSS